MAINEISVAGQTYASGYVDYVLNVIPKRVEPVRPTQMIAFSGSDAVAPALDGTGDLVLTATSQNKTIRIPWIDLRPKGYVLQATTAAAKVVQLDIVTAACNPYGHEFNVSITRQNENDPSPIEESYSEYFDENCTYTDAQKIAAIVARINGTALPGTGSRFVTASANGTTGIIVTAKNAGEDLWIVGGGALAVGTVTTQAQVTFGTGASLIQMGFDPSGINTTSTYKIIVLRYNGYLDFALLGMQRSQKEENGSKVIQHRTCWVAFETTAQDTNYSALTAIVYPTESRFKRLSSLTAVN